MRKGKQYGRVAQRKIKARGKGKQSAAKRTRENEKHQALPIFRKGE